MNLRKRITCLLKRHVEMCVQTMILKEQIVEHSHNCLRCGRLEVLLPSNMTDEMIGILEALVADQMTEKFEPAQYIH